MGHYKKKFTRQYRHRISFAFFWICFLCQQIMMFSVYILRTLWKNFVSSFIDAFHRGWMWNFPNHENLGRYSSSLFSGNIIKSIDYILHFVLHGQKNVIWTIIKGIQSAPWSPSCPHECWCHESHLTSIVDEWHPLNRMDSSSTSVNSSAPANDDILFRAVICVQQHDTEIETLLARLPSQTEVRFQLLYCLPTP
jgi:hypothetical protein